MFLTVNYYMLLYVVFNIKKLAEMHLNVNTVEPLYNEVLGTMKITLLYQVSRYIKVKNPRNIKSWDQQNDLVIRGFCYIRPLYNEVPLYYILYKFLGTRCLTEEQLEQTNFIIDLWRCYIVLVLLFKWSPFFCAKMFKRLNEILSVVLTNYNDDD